MLSFRSLRWRAVLMAGFMTVTNVALCVRATNPRPAGVPSRSNPVWRNAVQAYLGRLRARLIKNWTLADGKNTVNLEAVVDPTGSVSDIKTSAQPVDDLAVESANLAFTKAQPLEPLPGGFKTSCKLIVTFTSSVDPHGDSNSSIDVRIEPIKDPIKEPMKDPMKDPVKDPGKGI